MALWLVLAAGLAPAAKALETPGYLPVGGIQVLEDGQIAVMFDGIGSLCPDGPSNPSVAWIDGTDPSQHNMYRLVHAAHIAQRQVSLTYSCDADNRPVVEIVHVN